MFLATWTTRVFIPGDERSRTNPGHGYPEGYETHHVVKTFGTETEFQQWIERQDNREQPELKLYRATPLRLREKIEIEIAAETEE